MIAHVIYPHIHTLTGLRFGGHGLNGCASVFPGCVASIMSKNGFEADTAGIEPALSFPEALPLS